MFLKLLSYLLLGFLLAACQSLSIDMPGPYVEPPETPGKKQFTADLVLHPSQDVTVVNNAGNRPPDLTQPHSANSAMLGGYGDYGFIDRISGSLSFNTSLLNGTYFFGRLKFLPFGTTVQNRSEGFQWALWGRGGYGHSSSSGDQDEAFGSGGFPWTATANDSVTGAGSSLGYRFNKYFMTYVGVARDWHYLRSKISQDTAKGVQGGTYKVNLNGRLTSGTLGFQYLARWARVGVQFVYSEFEFELANRNYDLFTGLSFGVNIPSRSSRSTQRQTQRRKKPRPLDGEESGPSAPAETPKRFYPTN